MNIDNLDIVKQLIAEKENGQVEFKETTGQLERGMETLCAFLNSEGGTVLFGVTDKGKIIGQEVSRPVRHARTYHCQPEGQEQHQEVKPKDQPHREEELRKREGRF